MEFIEMQQNKAGYYTFAAPVNGSDASKISGQTQIVIVNGARSGSLIRNEILKCSVFAERFLQEKTQQLQSIV
jgi:hypothetical protein